MIGLVDDRRLLGLVLEIDFAAGQDDMLHDQSRRSGIRRRLGRVGILGWQAGGDPAQVQQAVLVLDEVHRGTLQPDFGQGRRPFEQAAQQFEIHEQPFQAEHWLAVGFGQQDIAGLELEQEGIEGYPADRERPLHQLGHLGRHESLQQIGQAREAKQGIDQHHAEGDP